jgi:hypothetical protein
MIEKHRFYTLNIRSRLIAMLRFIPLSFVALQGRTPPPFHHGFPCTATQLGRAATQLRLTPTYLPIRRHKT